MAVSHSDVFRITKWIAREQMKKQAKRMLLMNILQSVSIAYFIIVTTDGILMFVFEEEYKTKKKEIFRSIFSRFKKKRCA